MSFADLVSKARGPAALRWRPAALGGTVGCLFFSVSDGPARAVVLHATGRDFDRVWSHGLERLARRMAARRMEGRWLRVDWIEAVEELPFAAFEERLARTKRNYFRRGICFDATLRQPLTEQELNANAILHAGEAVATARLNRHNLGVYALARFGRPVEVDPAGSVLLFSTGGVFVDATGCHELCPGEGLDAGRRRLGRLEAGDVLGLVARGSRYLARQVGEDGRFAYGWFPCFDRPIGTYNTLRHASSAYALIEAWQLTREPELLAAAERAIRYLLSNAVADATGPDGPMKVLVDEGSEIKLGGNAVLVLALAKHCEATGTSGFAEEARQLALGIGAMQDAATGRFVHVLNFPDLSVKEENRIIYYEGEAAFALMRLYRLTGEARWLDMVERAFAHFIAAEHWRMHDHWLSYCVNELTLVRPKEAYFRFGLKNVAGHLDFIGSRITTFPTLLELAMAADAMLRRLSVLPNLAHLLSEIDLAKFRDALEWRAHHLLDGHFWPETAMYFRKPDRIVDSFFIRHHGFRVRIDDVEHYLSGLVAYHAHVAAGRPSIG